MGKAFLLPIILLFISCGKEDKRCFTGTEMRMRCQVEEMEKTNGVSYEWQAEYCNDLYPVDNFCY